MKYLKLSLVFCCGLLLLAACKKNKKVSNDASSNATTATAKTIDYDAMANQFCACMKPLVDMNKEIQSLMEAGATEKIQAMFPQVEALSKDSESCIAKLEAEYGNLTKDQEAKAEQAMSKACPDVAAMVQAAEAMEKK